MSAASYGLVLLGGDLANGSALKRLARGARAVICADGGARHAAALGLQPQFVVGDMDSLPKPLPRWRKTIFACDFDEDRSDFDKALDLSSELGLRRVFVACALGGALDHCLVNLAVIAAGRAGLEIVLADRGTGVLLGPGRHALSIPKGKRFSILAAGPRAKVSLTGARYPLKNQRLTPGSRGLGNRSSGAPVLRIASGRVWLLRD